MDIEQNLRNIQQRFERACVRAGRTPSEVTLLAVTKGHPPETVQMAAELGLTVFGENKIQEAKAKIPMCSSRLHWQMIGHLQSNKCRDAVHFFEMIQSIDSLPLAEEVNRRADQAGKTIPVLLEVNAVGEASKFGYSRETLLRDIKALNALRRIEVQGLMTVPPWTPDPEKVRPVFRLMRELKGRCEEALGAPLPHLSMGMSGDFEVAVEEGATIVRIGTALFGARKTRPTGGQ
jgi:pyridoxal phosphate enzyme (YggS family)